MNNVIKITLIFILIIGVINVFSPACKCEENGTNVLYVGGNGDGNYSNLQDAIDNSSEDDTIIVFAGTYNESILINKSISIIGENKDDTIISGVKNTFDVITINAFYVNITGFTIRDGPVTGILIDSSGNCNIYQNNINNNHIGIDIFTSSNLNIFNNTISNNNVIGLNVDCSLENEIPFNDLYSAIDNIIYHNNFINNTQHANDNCTTSWSHNNEGNYYDDYSELDKNNDGIGDTPYEIPGGDNVDQYPLMAPYDGEIKSKEFIVDYDLVFTMLIIGIIISIIFVLPIALWWRKKYFL